MCEAKRAVGVDVHMEEADPLRLLDGAQAYALRRAIASVPPTKIELTEASVRAPWRRGCAQSDRRPVLET
jgi:hypothetical protein